MFSATYSVKNNSWAYTQWQFPPTDNKEIFDVTKMFNQALLAQQVSRDSARAHTHTQHKHAH